MTSSRNLLTIKEVRRKTKKGKNSIKRWVKEGSFPPPVCRQNDKPNAAWLWDEAHVDKWQEDLLHKYPWTPPSGAAPTMSPKPSANDHSPDHSLDKAA